MKFSKIFTSNLRFTLLRMIYLKLEMIKNETCTEYQGTCLVYNTFFTTHDLKRNIVEIRHLRPMLRKF